MRILINLLWIYPAIILTIWTLLTFLVMRILPQNRTMPSLFAVHPMAMMYNPKDNILYGRPSMLEGLLFLIAGLIPLVNAIGLVAVIAMLVTAAWSHGKYSRQKKIT